MAKKNPKNDGPATRALATLIDRGIERGMRALNIRSLTELKREAERYPSTDDSEHKGVASELLARMRCVELLWAIAHDGFDNPIEWTDEWLSELRRMLPKAIARTLTQVELRPIVEEVERGKKVSAVTRTHQFWANVKNSGRHATSRGALG
jgi:hypothetical protein